MTILSETLDRSNSRDIAGISASLLCVLHCLATPFLVTMMPLLAATEHETHNIFAIIILLIGILAFVPGYRKHKKTAILVVGAVGITAIIAAAMLPEMEVGETIETLLVVAGGLALIGAHLRNLYWCRFCQVCCEKSCS